MESAWKRHTEIAAVVEAVAVPFPAAAVSVCGKPVRIESGQKLNRHTAVAADSVAVAVPFPAAAVSVWRKRVRG